MLISANASVISRNIKVNFVEGIFDTTVDLISFKFLFRCHDSQIFFGSLNRKSKGYLEEFSKI